MKAHDLSSINYQASHSHEDDLVAIVVSKWNADITEELFKGAFNTLLEVGLDESSIYRYDVPGSFELPLGAKIALDARPDLDGVICIGCVVQGETRHFEFISQAVSHGIMQVNLEYGVPTIFGVLTPDTQQQAIDRAGGKYGNKGTEAAVALLEMIDLKKNN